jgi:hypothetical protein
MRWVKNIFKQKQDFIKQDQDYEHRNKTNSVPLQIDDVNKIAALTISNEFRMGIKMTWQRVRCERVVCACVRECVWASKHKRMSQECERELRERERAAQESARETEHERERAVRERERERGRDSVCERESCARESEREGEWEPRGREQAEGARENLDDSGETRVGVLWQPRTLSETWKIFVETSTTSRGSNS